MKNLKISPESWNAKLFLGLAFLCLPHTHNAEMTCSNEGLLLDGIADVLFLIDSSSSMGNYTQAVADGMTRFASQLQNSSIDAQFAVATFGGAPTLHQKFLVFITCALLTISLGQRKRY